MRFAFHQAVTPHASSAHESRQFGQVFYEAAPTGPSAVSDYSIVMQELTLQMKQLQLQLEEAHCRELVLNERIAKMEAMKVPERAVAVAGAVTPVQPSNIISLPVPQSAATPSAVPRLDPRAPRPSPVLPQQHRRASNPQAPPPPPTPRVHAVEPAARSRSTGKPLIRNIHELKSLMEKAYKPGNDRELRIIQELCAHAHDTPQPRRTEMDKFVLTRWRNPNAFRPSGDAGLNNPQIGDPVQAWWDYYCHHRASWPRGVRSDAAGKPIWEDLVLRDLVTRLRPNTDGERLANRNIFLNSVWALFADDRLYRDIVIRNEVAVGRVLTTAVVPFPSGRELTSDAIAEHFAQCGVTIKFAEDKLGPWARMNVDASAVAGLGADSGEVV